MRAGRSVLGPSPIASASTNVTRWGAPTATATPVPDVSVPERRRSARRGGSVPSTADAIGTAVGRYP